MYCTIRCSCGYEADLDKFTPPGMPLHSFKCPSCSTGWRVKATGMAKVFNSGLVIPATRKIEFLRAAPGGAA